MRYENPAAAVCWKLTRGKGSYVVHYMCGNVCPWVGIIHLNTVRCIHLMVVTRADADFVVD